MKNFTLLTFLFLFSHLGFSQGLNENFETAPAAPAGGGVWALGSGDWMIFDNGVGVNNWRLNTVAFPAFSAPNAAFIANENIGMGNTSMDYLATPLIELPANAQLRFQTRMTVAGNQGTLYQIRAAAAASDPSLAASYTTLVAEFTEDDLSVPGNVSAYLEKVVSIPASVGANAYFAFVKIYTQPTTSFSGDRWLVDDVRIVSECFVPATLTATGITQTTANLSWANPSGATQWEIEIMPFAATPTGTGVEISANPFAASAVTNGSVFGAAFTPSTQYKYRVRAICAGPNSTFVTSDWSDVFAFSTSSPGLTCVSPIVVGSTPYSTTDNTANYSDSTDVIQAPGCATGTLNYMTGNEVFYSYTPTESGAISITMTPTGTRSGLFVYQGCANVGVACLAGVANTASTIREIPSLNVTAGVEYIIVISTATAPQTTAYTLVIQTLNCAPPTGLSATGTGPNSANLSWNAGVASSWEVFVQTAGSAIPAGAGTTTTVNTNYEVTTLTESGAGLVLGTPYQYWVRADCGDGTFSPWAGPYLFNTTSCSIGCNYNFVMTDTFGDGWNGNTMNVIQDGLTIATIGSTFTTGNGPVTVSVPLCDGPFELFWNSGGSFAGEVGVSIVNSFGQTIYIKAPNTGTQNSLLFSGVVDCSTPGCLPPNNLTATSPTTDGAQLNWTPNGSVVPVSWEIYAVAAGSPAPDAATTPTATIPGNTPLPYTITGLLADTTYTYYVRAVCTGGGANPWSTASPNFTTLPTCPKPTAITLTGATQDSLVLDWTNGGAETQWQYIVQPSNLPAPTPASTGWTITSSHPVTIPGLTAGTQYHAYVMAICSPTDSSTVAGPGIGQTTVCAPADQCLYTFTMTDSFGDGWNGNTMAIQQNGVTVATIGSTFTTGTGPVTVQVPLCNGVPFTLFWNSGGAFAGEVGVSITSFLGEVIYTKAPGTGTQNSVLYSGTGECVAPTCLKPTNVIVSAITLDSAIIAWTENNTPAATSWDILVLPATAPAPLPNATGWVNVSTNPAPITGLTAATSYKVYVRAVCSSTDSSFWSVGTQFSTTVCLPSDVCEYTFTMWDSWGDGWNGNTMNVTQNGILITTLTGPTAADDTNPITQTVVLCNNLPFELFWNAGGAFAGEVGVSITNQDGTIIFTKAPGTGTQNSTLFTGTVLCVPATCPKPVQLAANNITETSAELSWFESGTATSWEIIILPAGSPAPTPATVGLPATNPYTATLTSGTAYVFYVRAICAADDISNWSGPLAFNTLISNDECDTAVVVPVNPDQSCAQTVSGTVIGATASTQGNTCFGTDDDDVWFEFVATGTVHTIDLTNVAGSTADLYHVVYSGTDCDSLTQLYCSDANNSVANNLTAGQTYKIRVYTWTGTPNQNTTFTVCIGTIPPPISSSTTQYTATELVEDILLNTTCANVTNITFSTGSNFGSVNGLGYFNQNGSTFPFADGIVLSTGNANSAPGPNTTTLGDGASTWPGDIDLQAVLAAQGVTGTLNNATKLEFDFVPLTNNISFNFIFASEEYGTFQCTFSDVFAFLLTDMTTGITTNLAVVPGTATPISVTTIRDALYNGGCASANAQYFGNYFAAPLGLPMAAPINFNGMTVPLTASSAVIPGNSYHIKLAIADYSDSSYDSAVFLEGGSFDIGNIELGGDFLVEEGTALCSDGVVTLDSELDPDLYDFVWLVDGVVIDGQTGPTLTVTEEGNYTLQASYEGTTCTGEDSIIVEFYDAIVPGTGPDLYACATGDTGLFDLTQNITPILAPLSPDYDLTYYLTQEDAEAETNAISTPTAYTNISNPQTIFVRVENTVSGCVGFTSFNLIVADLTPQFTLTEAFTICEGETGTITVTPTNFDVNDASFSWTLEGTTIPQTGSTISVTEGGTYEVTVNTGCPTTQSVEVTVTPFPQVTAPADVTVCDDFELPVLALGDYYTMTGGTGDMLPAGTIISETTTLYVYSADGTCSDEETFTITFNPATADAPANVVECTTYELPVLSADNMYYSETGGPTGTGTVIPVGTVYNTPGVYTIFVYADNGTCFAENVFTLTITGPVVADVLPSVTVCDNYVLPALSANNNYFTEPMGAGTPMFAGDIITQNMTLYIYAVAGECTDESSFTVTVAPAVADEPANVVECTTYELPTLSTGNSYYTETGGPTGAGVEVAAGTIYNTVGVYTLYVYAVNGACTDEHMFTVTIAGTVVADVLAPVESCDSYVLQPLSANNNYFTEPNGGGTQLFAGDTVTTPGVNTIYVYAAVGTCTDESIFTLTISPTPIIPQVSTVNACDVYLLPTISVGDYYTAPGGPNGGGNLLQPNDPITSDTTIYIYAQSGTTVTCSAETSFDIFITPSPVVNPIGNVSSCESYTLPAIVGDGDYFTQADGQGTMLMAGDVLTTSQDVFVFSDNGVCQVQISFTVTIGGTPDFNITGECENNVYVLTANVLEGTFNPDLAEYTWSTVDGTIINNGNTQSVSVSGAGTYTLSITVPGSGCQPVVRSISPTGTSCLIQKGISPNGDGMNDCFKLAGFNVDHLAIFNRYGVKVYERGNYVEEWCGQADNGDELPDGTYYYVIERAGEPTTSGWIYITREN